MLAENSETEPIGIVENILTKQPDKDGNTITFTYAEYMIAKRLIEILFNIIESKSK